MIGVYGFLGRGLAIERNTQASIFYTGNSMRLERQMQPVAARGHAYRSFHFDRSGASHYKALGCRVDKNGEMCVPWRDIDLQGTVVAINMPFPHPLDIEYYRFIGGLGLVLEVMISNYVSNAQEIATGRFAN